MAITGSVVDWAVFWQIAGYTALGCAVTIIVFYFLRKRISRATVGLWFRPWVAWQSWSASHARKRERTRSRR